VKTEDKQVVEWYRFVGYRDIQLIDALRRAGLLDAFVLNGLRCSSCGRVLDERNIGVIVYDPPKGRASCRSPACMNKVSQKEE
jgi:hypothetical protein